VEKIRKFYHKIEMKGVKCEKMEENIAIWVWHLNDRNCTQVEEVKERANIVCKYCILLPYSLLWFIYVSVFYKFKKKKLTYFGLLAPSILCHRLVLNKLWY
jgi:hypothetical protein